MSGLHSTGHARRGFPVREDHGGDADNREGHEKPVANWQAAKKPALPLALKSRYAMPSRPIANLCSRGAVLGQLLFSATKSNSESLGM